MKVARESVAGYDLIGDVHGCAAHLEVLLARMGYRLRQGTWQHPDRKAIFVGDVLDRGPAIRQAMTIVQRMVDDGHGYLVLGNHEYNAVVYSTLLQHQPSNRELKLYQRLRRHLRQSLLDYQHHGEQWFAMVRWLQQQPLSLEFDQFRVVHAGWDDRQIGYIQQDWSHQPLLHEDFIRLSLVPGEAPQRAIQRLLKGVDLRLPDGHTLTGADGIVRNRVRANFWTAAPKTYGDVLFQPDKLPLQLMNTPLSPKHQQQLLSYDESQKPLFFGHYWCQGQPSLIRHNIACLDYSAVNQGALVAYRMSGEAQLKESNFAWVNADLSAQGAVD